MLTNDGTSDNERISNESGLLDSGMSKERQRAPRACLGCRSLKVKCELYNGDATTCVRCKRENKTCVFVASKRGGKGRRNGIEKSSLDTTRPYTKQEEQNLLQAAAQPHISPGYHASSLSGSRSPFSSDLDYKTPKPHDHDNDDISLRTIQNPSDSLHLLAQTAFTGDRDETLEKKRSPPLKANGTKLPNGNGETVPEPHNAFYRDSKGQPQPPQQVQQHLRQDQNSFNERLAKFCLVQAGIVTPVTLRTLVSTFFSRHHQYMPMIPAHRIQRTDAELCALAEAEPLLTITFVIIASRFEDEKVHTASWKFMSHIIQELVLGYQKPTLGAVEALLILSENVPKCEEVSDKNLYEFEERFSWHLVGQAVRMSYYLGIDQKTLLDSDETMSDEVHRMRLIWTYCYFEERQTAIRFGKAFWTRGPTLCFPSSYVNSTAGPLSLSLIPSANSLEDYSSYTQALIDSTNLLSNIHDLLYPTRDRTISLVHLGDYTKILDELTMGFAAYKLAWEKKTWDTLSLNETVWVSFNYAKLYAYGFAFEAHMKRTSDLSESRVDAQSMFPMSLSATSDAKFIIEAKNAAIAILQICVNNLHTYGAMAYLPGRYYGYFGHAAVFLIKIIFTEAVNYNEQRDILNLIGGTIACFCHEFKGLDRYHPLIRCAQQLRTLLQTLWTARGVNFGVDAGTTSSSSSGSGGPLAKETMGYTDVAASTPLADDILNVVDNFSFDQFSPEFMRDSAEAAIQDLATTFSNDLNGDLWLSYFNQGPAISTGL